jgi:hypothetical protein
VLSQLPMDIVNFVVKKILAAGNDVVPKRTEDF